MRDAAGGERRARAEQRDEGVAEQARLRTSPTGTSGSTSPERLENENDPRRKTTQTTL
jgi:hypothetical protein